MSGRLTGWTEKLTIPKSGLGRSSSRTEERPHPRFARNETCDEVIDLAEAVSGTSDAEIITSNHRRYLLRQATIAGPVFSLGKADKGLAAIRVAKLLPASSELAGQHFSIGHSISNRILNCEVVFWQLDQSDHYEDNGRRCRAQIARPGRVDRITDSERQARAILLDLQYIVAVGSGPT